MKAYVDNLLQGKMISKEKISSIFNDLGKQILDKREITIDLQKVTFISVYFLERLEEFVERAKTLNVVVRITNVQPSVYKVFQVGRVKEIINSIVS